MVDSRKQGFFVNALLCLFGKNFLNRVQKFLFLTLLGIFCHHREEGLQNAVLKFTVHIVTDALVNQRLF